MHAMLRRGEEQNREREGRTGGEGIHKRDKIAHEPGVIFNSRDSLAVPRPGRWWLVSSRQSAGGERGEDEEDDEDGCIGMGERNREEGSAGEARGREREREKPHFH